MKKVDTEILEKMAKEKNIDKEKIEKIANGYKGKSEGELMDELVKIGKTLEGKEQVVSKLKTFLNDEQRKKLDAVMDKIYNAEVKDKIENKKNKSKKYNQLDNLTTSSSNTKKVKKTKKVVKKVKKIPKGE